MFRWCRNKRPAISTEREEASVSHAASLSRLVLSHLQRTLDVAADQLQFAYKSRMSALDTIAMLPHQITSSPDRKGGYLRHALLDFSSASNTVPRQRIVESINSFGASCHLVDLISNFLSDRTQFVLHRKGSSDLLSNNCGLPQGDVLVSFFFYQSVRQPS